MTDYDGISKALNRAIDALTEELTFLTKVKADQNIIDSVQGDIILLNEAIEIVYKYEDLDR